MRRKPAAPVFKPYIQNQVALLPPSYAEMIPAGHLVRVVNQVINEMDLRPLLQGYEGGGTSSYHPKMMLKVLVYAYCEKIYSSRKIAKALRENLYFMWLSGANTPDFRTINDFRGKRMKPVIDEVFSLVLEYLMEGGYVKLEHYFVDGTKIEADANKHKVVWAKRKDTYQKRVRQQIKDLIEQIEKANQDEQAEYGEKDLEELGGNEPEGIDSERLKKKIDELNQRLRHVDPKQPEENEKRKAARQALKKLEKDCLPRLEKYEQQTKTLAGRSSYSQTDPDASCMRMKEDRGAEKPWPRPAYNLQAGTEGQFIVGFSVHPRAGDPACLIPHLEQLYHNLKRFPQNIIGDAAYGSEENYAYAQKHQLGNYLKYNTFYQDTHHYRNPEVLRAHQFRAENFAYDQEHDQFICPAGKRLAYDYESSYSTHNGYLTRRRHYECHDCSTCPLKSQCTQARGNRKIRISLALLNFRTQARQNLTSEEGQRLRKRRSVEVETVFGHLKHNMGFRRFHLRGLEKVKTEFGLLSMAHNLRKLAG